MNWWGRVIVFFLSWRMFPQVAWPAFGMGVAAGMSAMWWMMR